MNTSPDVYLYNDKPLYKLTDIAKTVTWPDGSQHLVRRMMLCDNPKRPPTIPDWLAPGDLLGWVESMDNLVRAGAGNFFSASPPIVMDNAVVSGPHAKIGMDSAYVAVYENAMVYGEAYIGGYWTEIHGNAKVGGNVSLGWSNEIFGNAEISVDNKSRATFDSNVKIFENARITVRNGAKLDVGKLVRMYGDSSVELNQPCPDSKPIRINGGVRILGTAKIVGMRDFYENLCPPGYVHGVY